MWKLRNQVWSVLALSPGHWQPLSFLSLCGREAPPAPSLGWSLSQFSRKLIGLLWDEPGLEGELPALSLFDSWDVTHVQEGASVWRAQLREMSSLGYCETTSVSRCGAIWHFSKLLVNCFWSVPSCPPSRVNHCSDLFYHRLVFNPLT